MASVWLRHPRYSLLILVTFITTFYLLFVPHEGPSQRYHLRDDSLEARVQRSHMIYDKFLEQRKRMLIKWGPDLSNIDLYVVVLFAFMKSASDTCPVSLKIRNPGLLTLYVSCISLILLHFCSRRRVSGDFFTAAFNCPHEVERHGALGDGGKWVCGLSRVAKKPDCIVYSFGK